jgi:hypothetical protein
LQLQPDAQSADHALQGGGAVRFKVAHPAAVASLLARAAHRELERRRFTDLGLRRDTFAATHLPTSASLVAAYHAEVRPALLRLEDRRLPLAGQVLEAVGVEQFLVKLASLDSAPISDSGG